MCDGQMCESQHLAYVWRAEDMIVSFLLFCLPMSLSSSVPQHACFGLQTPPPANPSHLPKETDP